MTDDLKKKFNIQAPPPGSSAMSAEYIAQLEEENRKLKNRTDLPFLYGWKWYKWAREFFESRNPINLLCAANQISKSSTQIRKCIHWATAQDEWPDLWAQTPTQFWYLYPSKGVVNAEFETKWKQFLPKGEMKKDPYYGWKEERSQGNIVAIHFNSGVHVYFKTYEQNRQNLQTGTCDAIFCDEELPYELFDELMLRLSASAGYFHMVFTATLGQDFWRRTMEPGEEEKEELASALKMTVSLYEAMFYEDGSPSHWNLEKIKRVEARCSTDAEVQKRVFGRFIIIGGRKYESFDIKRHFKTKHPIPDTWLVYAGADIGGGGPNAHKSALCYVAVRPDFRAGRVFLGWRGDHEITTSGDVVNKHIAIAKEHKLNFTGKHYDWGNKDFGEIAIRMGHPFEKAEKSHEIGEDVLNTLFKNDMLFLYEDEEIRKLGAELATLKKKENKKTAKDDFADALRYCVAKIPWDWTFLTGGPVDEGETPEKPLTDVERQMRERRKRTDDDNESERHRIEDEFAEWNDAYEGY